MILTEPGPTKLSRRVPACANSRPGTCRPGWCHRAATLVVRHSGAAPHVLLVAPYVQLPAPKLCQCASKRLRTPPWCVATYPIGAPQQRRTFATTATRQPSHRKPLLVSHKYCYPPLFLQVCVRIPTSLIHGPPE